MTRFNQCPNCDAEPSKGFFGGGFFHIYECKECETLYCYKCGGSRCPDCGSKSRKEAGECWGRKKD